MRNRDKEIFDSIKEFGVDETAKKFNINRESVKRAKRRYKEAERGYSLPQTKFSASDNDILKQLKERFTPKEIKAILTSGFPTKTQTHKISYTGESIKFGIISDTHIGSQFFDPSDLRNAFEIFEDNEVDYILHVGDVTEGMSNRNDQVYTLSEIGYSEQKRAAIELFRETDIDIYAIDGNHDRWFMKSCGAKIVQDIAEVVDNFNFIGHDNGYIDFGGLKVRLWHGEDGSTVSLSLRCQKIVDLMEEEEKPDILFCGHTHKAICFKYKGVWVCSCPSMQSQTNWMLSNKLSAHTGFMIVEVIFNDDGVVRFKPEFFQL